MPDDSVYFETHTGKLIGVEGSSVQARWPKAGTWETLVIEKKAHRRLSGTTGKAQDQGNFLMIILMITALTLFAVVAMRLLPRSKVVSYKVHPANDQQFITLSEC